MPGIVFACYLLQNANSNKLHNNNNNNNNKQRTEMKCTDGYNSWDN